MAFSLLIFYVYLFLKIIRISPLYKHELESLKGYIYINLVFVTSYITVYFKSRKIYHWKLMAYISNMFNLYNKVLFIIPNNIGIDYWSCIEANVYFLLGISYFNHINLMNKGKVVNSPNTSLPLDLCTQFDQTTRESTVL